MRYHTQSPKVWTNLYGREHVCDHPVYNRCTLFEEGGRGLAVIRQRYLPGYKTTQWGVLEGWLADAIYLHPGFRAYFEARAEAPVDDIYPTVTVRQIMWALKMKPLKRERWETVFDRRLI